jgi:DNA-binding MarR family transcriptional regulator
MNHPGKKLTWRQYTVLQSLLIKNRPTAAVLGVRQDVLWRLEEMGMVTGGMPMRDRKREQWSITRKGTEAVNAMSDALEAGTDQPR